MTFCNNEFLISYGAAENMILSPVFTEDMVMVK